MDRDTHIKEEVFTLEDEEKTKAFAEHLGKFLSIGDVVFLHGEVGAGKTTLCRYLIRSLIGDAYLEVPSPTYTLIQIYEKDALGIAHVDLYRLAVPEEVEELGLEDLQKRGDPPHRMAREGEIIFTAPFRRNFIARDRKRTASPFSYEAKRYKGLEQE